MANLPLTLLSALTSVQLALLCKSVDVKQFKYKVVLKYLVTLEKERVFISCLGRNIKGALHCVVADNLGAHANSGLVESFNGPYVCRFCFAHSSEYQTHKVRSGVFPLQKKDDYVLHVQAVRENPNLVPHFGLKRSCPLTDQLNHFHFVSGYPPDALHDLFEGIVPRELALCSQDFFEEALLQFDLTE